MKITSVVRRVLPGLSVAVAMFTMSPLTGLAQTCTGASDNKGGFTCTNPGTECSPVTVGSGDTGLCATEGSVAGGRTCECKNVHGFTLSASPQGLSVVQGQSGNSTITVTPGASFHGNVTLSASGLPSGVIATFNPTSTTSTTGTSNLTLAASGAASTGTSAIIASGKSGNFSDTTTISLTVNAPPSPDYSLAASPASLTVAQGSVGNSIITVSSVNGFAGSVSLSASGLPSGVTATFSPVTTAGTSTLTLAITGTTSAGTSNVIVTGTSGILTRTANIILTSTAPTPYIWPPTAVLTQRYDNNRTGANLQEHVLTVASVSSPNFQKLYTIPVAGQVYAQPLLVPALKFPDGTTKNVLIVATMLNNVQAFQVDDAIHGPAFAPVLLWQIDVGIPLPANFMAMENSFCNAWVFNICINGGGVLPTPLPSAGSLPGLPPIPNGPDFIINNMWNAHFRPDGVGLYNINPSIGIVSTPVVDPRNTSTMFLVAKIWRSQPDPTTIENRVFKIDLTTGAVLRSTKIDGFVFGTSADTRGGVVQFEQTHHMQRPALLFQGGQLYVAFGSHQDTRPWHGWVFRFDQALDRTALWCSTPNAEGGAIWQAGNGIAGDAQGNVYVMTGNGCTRSDCLSSDGTDESSNRTMSNFADMFVQLSPALVPIGSFAPGDVIAGDQKHREDEDLDVGSSGPVVLPGTNVLIGVEKESLLSVLDTSTHLGMRQIFQAGQKEDQDLFGGGGSGYHHNHGDPVVWRSSDHGMTVYFWPERDYLRGFHWNDDKAVFDCGADANGCEVKKTTTPDQQSTFQSPLCKGCMPGGVLSISADGQRPGTGIVWASVPFNTPGSLSNAAVGGGLNNVVPGVLHAFDAENVATDLWNSEANSSRDGSFMFGKFNPPVVANGRVYMATFGSTTGPQAVTGSINVYGMRQWAKFIDYPEPPPVSVQAGAKFSVQARFFNPGTTAWTKGSYRLQEADAAIFGTRANPWGKESFDLPADVNPGDEVTITLSLTAPTAIGSGAKCGSSDSKVSCRFQWEMAQDNVGSFGDATTVATIVVVGASLPPPKCTCPGNQTCCEGVNGKTKCVTPPQLCN